LKSGNDNFGEMQSEMVAFFLLSIWLWRLGCYFLGKIIKEIVVNYG